MNPIPLLIVGAEGLIVMSAATWVAWSLFDARSRARALAYISGAGAAGLAVAVGPATGAIAVTIALLVTWIGLPAVARYAGR